MCQEPEKNLSRLYELTKHPLIYVILGALLGGHIVLQISGPRKRFYIGLF